jgi:dihydropyrimidinase
MSERVLIKNGKVVFETKVERADILIEGGIIKEIGNLEITDAEIIDATDNYVMPGFIDMHTHIDDFIGKYYLSDTYTTASEIALKNGITTLFTFITQKNGNTLVGELELALEKLDYQRECTKKEGKQLCSFAYHLTPVSFEDNSWKEIEMLVEAGFKTFKLYTTYKIAGIYSSYEDIENVLLRFKELDVTTLIHCEHNDTIESVVVKNLDLSNPFIHTLLRPKESEIIAIEKILDIAGKTQANIHIVHVSTAEGARLIEEYCKSYSNVTCETCPQYLFLDDEKLKTPGGHRWICSPPLRDKENTEKMKNLALHNFFEVYATDHCAFLKKNKDAFTGDIRDVPNGLPGIGALPDLIFGLYNEITDDALISIAQKLSTNPAKITGLFPMKGAILKNADADLVILNTQGIEHDIVSSESNCYETYFGMKSNLNIKTTFIKGIPIHF